jgi:two-component system LytT family response regulator
MNALRLLIVDDEPLIRAGIRADLEGMNLVEVAGECGCVAEAVEAIAATRFDVVLLDVQLPDGAGFDVIRAVGPRHMPAVVFVTAYDKYAIQAFEVNAVDYLLKPFDDLRLKESLDRVRARLSHPAELMQHLELLLEARAAQHPQKLVVRNGERFDFVAVESIDWIESANNYSILHCRGKDYVFSESLTSLERLLDPRQFGRVHRCHIVNLSRVVAAKVIPGGAYELELVSGARVNSGRQYADRMRRLLKSRP